LGQNQTENEMDIQPYSIDQCGNYLTGYDRRIDFELAQSSNSLDRQLTATCLDIDPTPDSDRAWDAIVF